MERQIITRMQKQENGSKREVRVSTIDLKLTGQSLCFETLVFNKGYVTGNEVGERSTESKMGLHKKYVDSLRQEGYSIVETKIREYRRDAA